MTDLIIGSNVAIFSCSIYLCDYPRRDCDGVAAMVLCLWLRRTLMQSDRSRDGELIVYKPQYADPPLHSDGGICERQQQRMSPPLECDGGTHHLECMRSDTKRQ